MANLQAAAAQLSASYQPAVTNCLISMALAGLDALLLYPAVSACHPAGCTS
jgi:hypothetical protein